MDAEPREQRLVFGEDAELYDKARPSYPDALIDDVVDLVGTGARAADLGCGTGKATRLLADRGITGVGVEAHPAMAAVARRHVAGRGWRVDVAEFERWRPQPGDVPFDLVACAQAWHWFNPEVRLHKAHDLLRPGGWLALWWNTHRPEPTPLRQASDRVYARLAPELGGGPPVTGRVHAPGHGRWAPVPRDLSFGVPLTGDYAWSRRFTTAEWLALLRTHSNHRMLDRDRLDRLLDALGRLIDEHGGVWEEPTVTELWAVARR